MSIPSERAGEFADVGLQFKAYFVWHCPGASGVSGDKGPTGDAGEYDKTFDTLPFLREF